MKSDQRDRYKDEIFKFLLKIKFDEPIAVTLTEKQCVVGYGDTKFYINNVRSSVNTKHFLNRLNQKIFKNSYRRFGKRLKSFVVMEGTDTIRHHIHLVLDKPNRVSFEDFKNLINDCWLKTTFGYHHTDVQQMYSDGWYSYLIKCRTKTDLLSDIDWQNTYSGVSK